MQKRQARLGTLAYLGCLLFICVGTLSATLASSKAITELEDIEWTLPCLGKDQCIPGKEDFSYVYSALHDPTLKQIAVFGDFNTTIFEAENTNVVCHFWLEDPEGEADITETAEWTKIYDAERKYSPYTVQCPDPLKRTKVVPNWVAIFVNGIDMGARTPIEQIALSKKADIGACMAPVYTPNFQMLYAWLNHYTSMGVEGFYLYWTTSYINWDGAASIPLPESFRPFRHPQVTWYQYHQFPDDERYYYGQQTVYNECVFRNRHSYEYLLMFDHDEFLILKDSKFGMLGRPSTLLNVLHHLFPPKHAALGIFRYAYRKDCQSEPVRLTPEQAFHEQYTHRVVEPESRTTFPFHHDGDKLIIRPKMVDIFYMHFIETVRSGFVRETVNALPSSIHIKHLRSYEHNCSELVTDEPYDLP